MSSTNSRKKELQPSTEGTNDADAEKPQTKKRKTEDSGSAKSTQNGKKRKREDENEEDENVLDDEQTVKKSNAASEKDSLSGDTNVNADENKDDEQSKAEAVAKHFGLNNVEVNLSEENEQGMTYLKFNKLIRPLIVEANPGTAHTKVNSLLGAIWSDYKRKKGKDTSSSNTPSPKAASKAKKQKNTSKSTKAPKQPKEIMELSDGDDSEPVSGPELEDDDEVISEKNSTSKQRTKIKMVFKAKSKGSKGYM